MVARMRDLGSFDVFNSDRSVVDTYLIGGGAGNRGLRGCWASALGDKTQIKTPGLINLQWRVREFGILTLLTGCMIQGFLRLVPCPRLI